MSEVLYYRLVSTQPAATPVDRCVVRNQSAAVPNATNTTIAWTTEIFDPGGWHSGTDAVVTVPADGWYDVVVNLAAQSAPPTTNRRLLHQVSISGAGVGRSGVDGTYHTTTTPNQSSTFPVQLTAGDTVAVVMFHDFGATTNFVVELAVIAR